MKILLITHLLPYPPRGGCSLRNFNLIRQASRKHDIHLLTFFQRAHLSESSDIELNAGEMRKYCSRVEVFEIPIDSNPIGWYALLAANLISPTPYSPWKFRSRSMADAVKKHIAENDYDLVEIGTIALAEYRKISNDIPCLLVHHNIESELLMRRAQSLTNPLASWYVALQGKKLHKYEAAACQSFDFHTTVSDRDAKILRDMRPDVRVAVVPNGVDTEYFKPGSGGEIDSRLVFVGGMGWYPNRDAMQFLIQEIWHLIEREVSDVTMTLIGKQPSKGIVEFSARHPGFKCLGFIDDVRPHIDEAAVYIVPLRVGGGTRLKILDAMAMGKAIVSTSIGCEGIDVTDGENIIIANTPTEIAQAVVRLFEDREERARLGKNARETAERLYSWEKIYPKLEAVYQQLAAMR
jgi:glycosyltransferase involved in cell wall biosynthesis